MAAKTKPQATETRKPVVVVDNVDVTYKVFASGRKATRRLAGGGLFSRKLNLREVNAVKKVSFTF